MKTIMKCFFIIFCLILLGHNGYGDTNDSMKEEIERLNKRVEELEKTLIQQQEQQQKMQAFPDRGRGQQQPFGFGSGLGSGWDPFDDLFRMQEEMNQMMQRSFPSGRGQRQGTLRQNGFMDQDFNLEEQDDSYIIRFDISGLNKDKLDINIDQHSITIKAEYSEETEEENPQGFYRSQSFGSFFKTIPLPSDADPSSLESNQEDEVLVLKLRKKKA